MKKLRFSGTPGKKYHLAIDAANNDARVYFDRENPEGEVSDSMAAGLLADYPANFKEVVAVTKPAGKPDPKKETKEVDPGAPGAGAAGPKKTK